MSLHGSSSTAPLVSEAEVRERAPQPQVIVAVLAFAGISVSLLQTLVIPVVGRLPQLLDTSATSAAWVVTATLLSGAVVTPVAGRLGDMLGKRAVLCGSLVMMVAGSVVCALSTSLAPMLLGRALQGFAAGVIPLGISLMRDVLPPERLGPATALMSGSLGVGGALGLPFAALIADNADWHALFWVASGLGAAVLILVAVLIPAPRPDAGATARSRFDAVGALGLSASLVCLLVAAAQGGEWGWGSPVTWTLIAAGLGIALAWVWFELRTEQPLVDLRTASRRQVLLTNIASTVFGFAMFAQGLVLPQLLQLPTGIGFGPGVSMVTAGLALVPGGIVMMLVAPLSAAISRTQGPRACLMLGALVVSVGYGAGTILTAAVWQVSIASALIGAGVGLAYGAMPALIMSAVPVEQTAAANSFNTLVRSVGSSVASAVTGAVLAASATTVGAVTAPSRDGFTTVLLLGAGAALLALTVAAFLPRGPRRPPPADLSQPVTAQA